MALADAHFQRYRDGMRTTDIDFGSASYHDSGGEIYPLTSCVRSDGNAYVAGPVSRTGRVIAHQKWLFPELGWFVGCATVRTDADPNDWYVDLVEIDVSADRWHVKDYFIDVALYDGDRYEVLDLDEFADAVESGQLSREAGLWTLRSLHRLCSDLTDADYRMESFLRKHAASLPLPQPWESVSEWPDGRQ